MRDAHTDAVIVAYGRSAVCKAKKGSFAGYHPIEWAAQVLAGVLKKVPQLDQNEISDVVVGCSAPIHELDLNSARLIALRAGLPESVSAQTINRFCSSSLQAVATCANAIMSGQEQVMVAGGVEDMSKTFGAVDPAHHDPWFAEHCPGGYMPMGITAENVAALKGITRAEMDAMAVRSHRRAAAAQERGDLNRSIIPVQVPDGDGFKTVTMDEGIRPDTNLETLGKLKPCFRENGAVTAATSSQTSDGAAFVVLMSAARAEELGIPPLARFVSFATAGCSGELMGLGPIYAVPRAMKKCGLSVDDMDVVELNEAFAAQAIPCIRELGLDEKKVNPRGGAIALGHPLGATGAILTCKALSYLEDTHKRYALITMCIGGGMGAAGIIERL